MLELVDPTHPEKGWKLAVPIESCEECYGVGYINPVDGSDEGWECLECEGTGCVPPSH